MIGGKMAEADIPLRGDPFDVVVPSLRNDAEYAAAETLLAAFSARLDQVERDRQIVDYEHHFFTRSSQSDSHTDKQLRVRLAALRAASSPASATPSAPSAPMPAIALGLAILEGEATPAPAGHEARVRALERNRDALGAAIGAQTEILDAIADRLTLKYATQLIPAWNALQLEMYRAAQELSRATQRVQQFRSRITAAGIRSRSDLLLTPNVRAPLMLGNESQWDSEISGWRRILERLKIL
jgi:hypothetical protein